MRIIAGRYGSRIIRAPRGHKTHPMGERIRSSLFNSLGDLSGKTVLDAFAGSGSLAIEAVSRGAESAVATESDRAAYLVVKANVEKLGAHNVQVVKASCHAWSSTNVDKKFDIIFCDPPYNHLQLSTVFALRKHLKPNGLMVLSYPGRELTPNASGVVVVYNRNYGDAALAYYRLR
ncbi:16S rRNA (guanine(966)-N(2))-methyltransferase RsmD [Candidatus Saccharibacteria bacterium]|nr:16S rRNA (guanine(966)-N(2))-methyltransferase RsmD [Candidatus Saccharibacteria bacterium]